MDGYMLLDMRHDHISLNFRNEKKWAKKLLLGAKNHLFSGFSALSICNHIEFDQSPIRSTRWMETCCLISDMTTFY